MDAITNLSLYNLYLTHGLIHYHNSSVDRIKIPRHSNCNEIRKIRKNIKILNKNHMALINNGIQKLYELRLYEEILYKKKKQIARVTIH